MLMNMNVNAVQAAAVGAASSTTTVQAGGVAASPAQKVLAPRMILSSQIIGARPGQPGEEEYQSEFSEFLMLSYKQSVSDKSEDGQEEQVVCGGGGGDGVRRRRTTTILPSVSSAAASVVSDDDEDNPSFPTFAGSNQSDVQESSVTELTCDVESEIGGVDEGNEKNSWTSSLPPPASPPTLSSRINSELCSLPESDLKGCDQEEANNNNNSQILIMSTSGAPSLLTIKVSSSEPANEECGGAVDPGGGDAGTAPGGGQDEEEEEEEDDTTDLFLEGDSLSEIVNSNLGNVDDKCDDEGSPCGLFQSNAADDDFSKSSPFHCVQQVAPTCESSESALPETITLYDNNDNNSEEDDEDQSGIITNSVTCMGGNGGVVDGGDESPFLDSSSSYQHHPLHNDNNNNNGAYPQTPKGPDVDSKEANLLSSSSDSSCIIVRNNNKIMSGGGGGEDEDSSALKCGSVGGEDPSSEIPFQPQQQQEPAQSFQSSSLNKQSNNLVRDLMMSSLGSDLFSTSETDVPFSNGAIIVDNSRSPSSSLSGSHNQTALPHDFPSSASSPNIRYAPMLSSCNTNNSSSSTSVPPNRKHSESCSPTSPVRIPPHSFQYEESSTFPMHSSSPASASNPVEVQPKGIIVNNSNNNVTSPDYRAPPRCFTNDAQLHSQFVYYNQQHPLGSQDGQQQQDYGSGISRKGVGQDLLLPQQTFPEQPLIPYNSPNYMSIPSNVPRSSGEHNIGSRIHSSSSNIAQGCLPPDGSSPTSTSSSSYPSRPNVPVAHSVLVSPGALYPSSSSGSFSFGPNPHHSLQDSSSSPHVSFGVNRGGHTMSVVQQQQQQQGGNVKIPPSSPSSATSHHNNGAPPMLSPPVPRFPMSHPRHGHPPPHSPGGGSSFGMPPQPRWMAMSPTNGPHGEPGYPPGSSYGQPPHFHQNDTIMRGDGFPAGAGRINSIRAVPTRNSNLAYRMPYETYPNDGRYPGRPNFPAIKGGGGGYATNHPQNVIIGRNNRNNNGANSNSNSRVQSMNIRIGGGGGYGNFGPPESIYRSGQGPQFSGGHHPHLQQQQQQPQHHHLHEAQTQYYSHAQQQQSSSTSAAPSLCSSNSSNNNNSGSTSSNNSVSVNSSSGGSVGHTTYPLVCRVSPIRSRYEDPSSSSSSAHHHHPQFSVPPYSQHGMPTPHHLQHQHAQRLPLPPAAFRGGGAYAQDSYNSNNVANNPYHHQQHHHHHPGAHHHPPAHHHHHPAAPPTGTMVASSSGRSGRLLMMMGDYNTYPYESQYNNKDGHHGDDDDDDDDDEEARSLRTQITLQALPGLPPGAQGHHLLVKTETGQYQLLRVGMSTQPQAPPTAAASVTNPPTTPQMTAPTTSSVVAQSASPTMVPSIMSSSSSSSVVGAGGGPVVVPGGGATLPVSLSSVVAAATNSSPSPSVMTTTVQPPPSLLSQQQQQQQQQSNLTMTPTSSIVVTSNSTGAVGGGGGGGVGGGAVINSSLMTNNPVSSPRLPMTSNLVHTHSISTVPVPSSVSSTNSSSSSSTSSAISSTTNNPSPVLPVTNPLATATYRLQTVPSVPPTAANTTGGMGMMTASVPMQHQQQQGYPLQHTQMVQGSPMPPNASATANSVSQMTAETAKMKCKNFLSFLLELSAKQNATVARNVKTLIQGLVDGKVNAEDFSERLQKEVNSQPQPCLVGFLKKSLPHLRQSLATRELTIDGIRAPSLSSIGPTAPVTALIPSNQQVRPQVMPTPVRIITPINSASSPVAASTTNNNAPIPRTTVAAVQQRFATPSKASALAGKGGALGKSSAASNATSASSLSSNVVSSSTTTKSSGPSSSKSSSKEKDKKGIGAAAYSGYGGDDDINDVAAMGGVNLAEESQRILGSTEFVGTQIRSCKDETFLPAMLLQSRIRATAGKFGIEDVAPEVAAMISHATEERLKNLLEKLSVIAEHRLDVIKADERYEVSQDVKGQLRFLEELNKLERKRHDEQEREILIKAAKSRSKSEDPEQAKLKAKAKEMQRVALEEMRQREANLTALQAIGPRKKPRLDTPAGSQSTMAQTPLGGQGASNSLSRPQMGLRPRLKRVNLRDLLFLMEQDKETQRSHFLYKNLLLK